MRPRTTSRTRGAAVSSRSLERPRVGGRMVGLVVGFILAASAVGCAGAGRPTRHAPSGGAPGEAPVTGSGVAAASLPLPTDDASAGAARRSLATLATRARGGDHAAAWARLHTLLDLFDQARIARDARARGVLLDALALRPGADEPSTLVTDRAVDALLLEADALLAHDRLHPGALAARALLAHDAGAPPDRPALRSRMAALKRIARGGGPLAANALVRLASWCTQAFADVARALPRERPLVLATCLYALQEADPEPYLARDPAARPPEPAWRDLAQGVRALTGSLAAARSRIAPLGGHLDERLARAVEVAEARGLLPPPLDPARLGVPELPATTVAPHDGEPLVVVATAPRGATLVAELRGPLAQDGRGRVALALAADAPASRLLDAVKAARRAGAVEVGLVAAYEQRVRAPAGDYWHGRAPGGRVRRLGLVPLALDPRRRPVGDARLERRWDPARAALGLHLVVTRAAWRLVTRDGAFPTVAAADTAGAAATLRAQLAQIRDAYGDEAGLIVAPGPDVPVGALAAALAAAGRDERGVPLFDRFALAAGAPPAARSGPLPARVARRAAARVVVAPDALAGRAPAVRRCYQEALDREPDLTGTLTVAPAPSGRDVVVSAGPRDDRLRRCVAARLRRAVLQGKLSSARVDLAR